MTLCPLTIAMEAFVRRSHDVSVAREVLYNLLEAPHACAATRWPKPRRRPLEITCGHRLNTHTRETSWIRNPGRLHRGDCEAAAAAKPFLQPPRQVAAAAAIAAAAAASAWVGGWQPRERTAGDAKHEEACGLVLLAQRRGLAVDVCLSRCNTEGSCLRSVR